MLPRVAFKVLLFLFLCLLFLFFLHFCSLPVLLPLFPPLLSSPSHSSSVSSFISSTHVSLPPHSTIHWITVCGSPASEPLECLDSRFQVHFKRKQSWKGLRKIHDSGATTAGRTVPGTARHNTVALLRLLQLFLYQILSLRLSQSIISFERSLGSCTSFWDSRDLAQISSLSQRRQPSGVLPVLSESSFLPM